MSRLPELEQELVATAARIGNRPRRFERRARTLVPAIALACLVVAALVAVGLFEAKDDGLRGGAAPATDGGTRTTTDGDTPTVADGAFPPDATLEDMLGVFRRPQTAADDMGISRDEMDKIPDRQPGEDFTQSRRVEWPGERIFMWPKSNGVCYGVAGGSGCPPLDELRRKGVSIGTGSVRGGWAVYGVVVDGIHEVVLTDKDGSERRVPVRENFFFADVDAGVDRVHWRYAGQDQSFSHLVPDLPDGPPPDPRGGVDAVPGSDTDPVHFTAGGVSHTAVGYQATDDTICVRVANPEADRPSLACQGIRNLNERLAVHAAELFAAGGTLTGLTQYTGFARGKVTDVETVEATNENTVVLSEPWSPAPWKGEPIRFLLVFDRAPADTKPGEMRLPQLRVRLNR